MKRTATPMMDAVGWSRRQRIHGAIRLMEDGLKYNRDFIRTALNRDARRDPGFKFLAESIAFVREELQAKGRRSK